MSNLVAKLLLLFLVVCFPSGGKAQDAEAFRGIWCDTQAQIERVVVLGTKLGGAIQGIEAVNAEAGSQACIHTTILGVRGAVANTIESPEGPLDVVPFKITAIATPFGLLEVEAVTWFTLTESKSRGV